VASTSGTDHLGIEDPHEPDSGGAVPEELREQAHRYDDVAKLLRQVPFEFQFFQAVRLFERLNPERAPVGRFVPPAREVVRFKAHQSLPFPASEIQRIEWPEPGSGKVPALVVNFFGLTGPQGVLPLYYTEFVIHRLRAKDTALAEFLDMFNHRMLSLFYRAWEKYRFIIAYERGERDRFSSILLSLIGLGTEGLQDRLAVQDDALLFYAGLLSLLPRSATALQQVLSDYFEVRVQVDQFVGAWYPLEESIQCRIDRNSPYSEQVGEGAIVGDEVWNQQCGARIQLGPMPLRRYLEFLPVGSANRPLREIAKFYARREVDFQIQLVLERNEVPACELGQTGDRSPLLGWTTWAKTAPMQRDPNDTILRI
jgi:type VI secretion system protein ImpH